MMLISPSRFEYWFTKFNWQPKDIADGKATLWEKDLEEGLFCIIPKSEKSSDYPYLQSEAIKKILEYIKLDYSENNFDNLYKDLIETADVINLRMVEKQGSNMFQERVPFEIAVQDVLMGFYGSLKSFLVSKFEDRSGVTNILKSLKLEQTEKGSYIFPIAVPLDIDNFYKEESDLEFLHSNIRTDLTEYLQTINSILEIDTSEPEIFANLVHNDLNISSSLFQKINKIVQSQINYNDCLDDIEIKTRSSVLANFKLAEFNELPKVNFKKAKKYYTDDFFISLKSLEDKDNDIYLDKKGVKMICEPDSLNGFQSLKPGDKKATFLISHVDGEKLKKPVRAVAPMTNSKLMFCVEAVQKQNTIEIIGDIYRPKGKTGKLDIDDIGNLKDLNQELF